MYACFCPRAQFQLGEQQSCVLVIRVTASSQIVSVLDKFAARILCRSHRARSGKSTRASQPASDIASSCPFHRLLLSSVSAYRAVGLHQHSEAADVGRCSTDHQALIHQRHRSRCAIWRVCDAISTLAFPSSERTARRPFSVARESQIRGQRTHPRSKSPPSHFVGHRHSVCN